MKRLFISAVLFLFMTGVSFFVLAYSPSGNVEYFQIGKSDTLLQGRWQVTQVAIEKNTNGIIETKTYKTVEEVKSDILCMKELEINEQSIVLRYADGTEETTEYILDDSQQTILMLRDDTILSYQYSANTGNLILHTSYTVKELLTVRKELVSEQWIITLKRNLK